jgi:hypothetical protein
MLLGRRRLTIGISAGVVRHKQIHDLLRDTLFGTSGAGGTLRGIGGASVDVGADRSDSTRPTS